MPTEKKKKVNSKRKGADGEREFANLCKEHGFDVRRTQQYCGNTGDSHRSKTCASIKYR